MGNTTWLKQTADKPAFEDLLWSRPQNKRFAGKLLIVGGNSSSFAAPAMAYSAALKAGVGHTKVLLPQVLQKTIGTSLAEAVFAPSTPSGSFARTALEGLLEHAQWADAVLLAGDFGRNSETAILLESFLGKYQGQVTLAGDAVDYFQEKNTRAIARENILYVINLAKLQKLAKNNRPSTPVLHNMNLQEIVTLLADWTNSSVSFITKHADNLIVASEGRVSTTPEKNESNWQTELAAHAAVWWLQNPGKTLEALTSATFEYLNNK